MSTEKPDPARGWLFVEKLLANERIDEVGALDDDAVAAALRARGRDPGKLASVDDLMTRASAIAAREAPPLAPVVALRRKPVRWVMWLAAAAFVLVAAFALFSERPDRVTRAPDPIIMRAAALEACRDHQWDACEDELDAARDLDPAGESAPSVKEARSAIEAARRAPKPL